MWLRLKVWWNTSDLAVLIQVLGAGLGVILFIAGFYWIDKQERKETARYWSPVIVKAIRAGVPNGCQDNSR
jgi:hypothetical protein